MMLSVVERNLRTLCSVLGFLVFARCFAVYALSHTLYISLEAEGAKVLAHGTCLHVHLLTQFVGEGGGKLSWQEVQEGQRTDTRYGLGLLLYLAA